MNETGRGGFGEHPENINKAGRPKFSLVSIIKDVLDEIPPGEKRNNAELLIRAYIADALERKDGPAIRDMINRFDGEPKKSVEISGGENPVGLIIVRPTASTEAATSTG